MLTFTPSAFQHIQYRGETVDRYQLMLQNQGVHYEILDLQEGCVVGPIAKTLHQGKSLIKEWLYS